MAIKLIKSYAVGIMVGQVLSSQLTKQLIQDLDCNIALNKGVCLGLRSLCIETRARMKLLPNLKNLAIPPTNILRISCPP